jgi:GT2 family glycosyltransferase
MGFGSACNKASRLCSSPLTIFVNCDTSFDDTDPAAFLALLALFDVDDIVIAGPRVVGEDGLLHASCFSFDPISILLKPARHIRRMGSSLRRVIPKYGSFKRRIDRITYEGMDKSSPVIVDWVSGCFAIVKHQFFVDVGGFDERYFMYFEDVDLCRKARQYSKCVVFDPRVSVTHRAAHQSARVKGIFRSILINPLARYHMISWIKYCYKWKRDMFAKGADVMDALFRRRVRSVSPAGYSLSFSAFDPISEPRQ